MEMQQATDCSICGLRHKIYVSKKGARGPINVKVLTGKDVTLSAAELAPYVGQFTIPNLRASAAPLMIEEVESPEPAEQSDIRIEEVE